MQVPESPALDATRRYLEAQARQDLTDSAAYFADDIVFKGLVLQAEGREQVSGSIQGFLQQAIDHIRVEAVTEVEPGRVMALYWFKLKPAESEQILCDHIDVREGRIARIENVFDVRKLPPME